MLLKAFLLLVLFQLWGTINAQPTDYTNEWRAINCKFEPLPSSLNSISYLDFNKEVHYHAEHFVNFTEHPKYVNFQLQTESVFKIYVGPHAVDVDLFLWRNVQGSPNRILVAASSLAIGTEEVIFQSSLSPDSYTIEFSFFGYITGGYTPNECDTITVEIAIIPRATLISRAQQFSCPSQPIYPSLNFSSFPVDYNSERDEPGIKFNVRFPTEQAMVRWATSYNFTIPQGDIALWRLEATLGVDFLTAGGLGLLVTKASSFADLSCFRTNECGLATNVRLNEITLRELLTPGDYTLWLYDHVDEQDSTVLPCSPFTLSLRLSGEGVKEDYLTCQAHSIPHTLIPSRHLEEPQGFFHLSGEMRLDLAERERTTTFQLNAPAFLKVYTAPHRVDIDLKLINASNGEVIEYVYHFFGEETIARLLPAGSYNVTFIFFGNYQPKFCETFYTEIAIVYQSFYPDFQFCLSGPNVRNQNPDLSSLQSDLDSGNSFYLKLLDGPYYFDYNNNYTSRQILAKNFTLHVPSLVYFDLGDNFVLGHMKLELDSFTKPGTVVQVSHTNERNRRYIRTSLEPGTYQFVLSTGSFNKATLTGFPPCSTYTLAVTIEPLADAGLCWQYDRLPETLNIPAYLSTAGVVHFAQQFTTPFFGPSDLKHTDTVRFTVTQLSFLRVWSEPHIIDIDFKLSEDGIQVASALRVNIEEELFFVLQAGKQYQLDVDFWHWESSDPHYNQPKCFVFDLELAISPVSPNGLACPPYLPPSDFIASATQDIREWNASQDFYFTQTANSRVIYLPFNTEIFVLFRASLVYDFVWTDISFELIANNDTRIYASNAFGSKDIPTQLLSPGSYYLRIYEPASMTLEQYRRCIHFGLKVAWRRTRSSSTGPTEFLGCTDMYLPPTLNTVPFLGFTQGQLHLQRNVLVNVGNRQDAMQFYLDRPSLFTIYLGPHSVVDVDLYLRRGNITNPGEDLASRTGYSEEVIYYNLAPGQYTLATRYYGYAGSPLPPYSACVYFPAEISIMPNDVLESISKLTQTCTGSPLPPAAWLPDSTYEGSFSRPIDRSFSFNASFTLSTASLFELNLRYQFLPGKLSASLIGMIDEGLSQPVRKVFPFDLGYNHVYLNTILPKGSYTVSLYDPRTLDHTNPNLHCSDYSLSYLLNSSSVPPDVCLNINDLPTDLYSAEGGSNVYGGPQAEDGSIRLVGENFLISIPNNERDNFVQFRISRPSLMRIFIHASANNDIDFYVYRNASRSEAPIYYSIGVDTIETKLWRLQPQAEPYLLDIFFFRVDPNDPCPLFSLEIAIKPESIVEQELLCPQVLPTPEVPNPVYDALSLVWENNNNFIFTQDRIAGNTDSRGRFTYRMLLNVVANSSLYTSVGFDFLANDFRLHLRRPSDGYTIASGIPNSGENLGDYINFYNGLFFHLEPGRYYLDIEEDLMQKDLPFDTFCHRFGFFMLILPEGNTSNVAIIEFVQPPSGTSLSPTQDLTISIGFSKVVGTPSRSTNTLQWIFQNTAVFLSPASNPQTHLFPNSATFSGDYRVLGLVFSKSQLALSQTYSLVINVDQFKTLEGLPFFLLGNQQFIYEMNDCQCNQHGQCVPETGACICDAGYTGSTCASCAPGYHGAGMQCVANVNCTANTCNGHGTCDDSNGYPNCRCDIGFVSTDSGFCTACAIGYESYPLCKSQNDTVGTRCTAPLLPSDLNEIGYLGFNGQMHIQADFYIDADHSQHEINFKLDKDSVFRLYAEPHWVDVDVWLYRVDGTSLTVIDYAIRWNEEEVIFKVLPSGNPPVQYKIKFFYYLWNTNREPDCETFNMELSIAPVAVVKAQTAAMQCSGRLPSPPGSSPLTYVLLEDNWSYTPTQTFSIAANDSAVVPHYFYAFDFEVKPPSGKTAHFQAELRYQFLPGDISFLLEAGTDRDMCGSKSSPRCILGSNLENRNRINELLPGGKYTLWIYEAKAQQHDLGPCSMFEMSASVQMVPLIEDVYYCEGSTFPRTFNSPGYLDFNGHLHVQEDFLLLEKTEVTFQLQTTSAVRISGRTEVASSFTLINSAGNLVASSSASFHPSLLAQLPPDIYTFDILSFFLNDVDRCPTINMEMEITPSNTQYANTCPGFEVLPELGTITVPFAFPSTPSATSFYAFTNNAVIRQWSFFLDSPAYLEVNVTSHFMTAGLRVELQFIENGNERFVYGSYNYNQHRLRETLDRGQYTLLLKRGHDDGVLPATFPPCAEFLFEMSLKTIAQADSDVCLKSGEPLPTAFNTIRFLGLDSEFDFQSSKVRVPSLQTFHSHHIPLRVSQPLLLRVYTEPHVVDIDIILYDDRSTTPVIHGGYGFNNAESILYRLEANVNYTLHLNFWKWVTDLPPCLEFNLEIAVSREHSLSSICPGGGADAWPQPPPSTGLPTNPYIYNSLQSGKTLYFQQRQDQTRTSPVYSFTLSASTNFYAKLGFDFISGGLLIKLASKDLGTTYYGDNTLNGNVLKLTALPAGSYELTIIELIKNLPELLGCSYYTFELYIEKDTLTTVIPAHPLLPTTLNSVAFLTYDGQVHLHNQFTMFNVLDKEQMAFTLQTSSLVRVTTSHSLQNVDEIQINFYRGEDVYSSHIESMLELMEPGSYIAEFRRPLDSENLGTIFPRVEFAVSPSSVLTQDLAPYRAPCADSKIPSIIPGPQGTYLYYQKDLKISQGTLKTKNVIYDIPIKLKMPSLVFIQVQYEFLITDLELNITGTSTVLEPVSVVGTNYRNLNQINQILPAGTYSLYITQPGNVLFTYDTDFPHCSPFVLRVNVRNSSQDQTHSDCSAFNVVPWNLDTIDGGSQPFGGPIDRSGSLHVSGENFLVPSGDHPIDAITFTVQAPSYFTVVARENYVGNIIFTMARGKSVKLIIPPLHSVSSSVQHIAAYRLDTPGPHELQLAYQMQASDYSACPYFGLQILLEPASLISNRSLCDPSATPTIPAPFATFDTDGKYYEYIDSFLPASFVSSHLSENSFHYNINITVAKNSRIIAEFAFDSLISTFHLHVLRGTDLSVVSTGQFTLQRSRTGSTNLNQLLSGTVRAGTYLLRITGTFQLPLTSNEGREYCFPFISQVLVLPNDNNFPLITTVSPPGGEGLSPADQIVLSLDFSAPVWSNNAPVTNDNTLLVQQAFSLVSPQNTVAVSAAAQTALQTWRIVFAGPFYPSLAYQLKFSSGSLQDPNGKDIQLYGKQTYRMLDTSCSGRGQFDSGFCFCSAGYAGRQCESCEVGYISRPLNGSKAYECVKCLSAHCACVSDTCSCEPGITPCKPLGTCSEDSNGNAVCSCRSGYDGKHCEKCASDYEGYPFCDKACPPGTVGPNCDAIVNAKTTYAGIEIVKYIGVSIAICFLLATIAFIVYKRFFARRLSIGSYGSLNEEIDLQ